jgi:hypothetical protein
MASVRFICGTQDLHKELEARLSTFLGTEDTILFSSCWDANGGLFEIVLGEEDAVISDALNHASIIDGVRLCKARRLRYANNDLAELEQRLKTPKPLGFKLDRHRRRLLDGRRHREPQAASATGRPARRDGDGRRLARRRLRASAVAAATSCAGSSAASTSSPAPSARRSAAPPAATSRAAKKWWGCCASAPARTSSRTR